MDLTHDEDDLPITDWNIGLVRAERDALRARVAELERVLGKADALADSVWVHSIDGTGTDCRGCITEVKKYREARATMRNEEGCRTCGGKTEMSQGECRPCLQERGGSG